MIATRGGDALYTIVLKLCYWMFFIGVRRERLSE